MQTVASLLALGALATAHVLPGDSLHKRYSNDSSSAVGVDGYTGASLGNAAINAPYDSEGYNTYMGAVTFQGAFDVNKCAAQCQKQTAYNLAHPPRSGAPAQTCQFFNTYNLYVNDPSNSKGQVCALYSESWPAKYATNKGQYRGSDHYLIQNSYSYSNTSNPGAPNPVGAIHQARGAIAGSNSLQSYCSSLLGATAGAAATVTKTVATVTPQTTVATTITTTVTSGGAGGTTFPVNKRATSSSTPAALSNYLPSIISAACSLIVTPNTAAATTVTKSVTATAATQTAYTTAVVTQTVSGGSTVVEQCSANAVLTFPYDSTIDNCACSYRETCGLLPDTSSCYGPQYEATYQACADVCDQQTDCSGFLYSANGTCTTCGTNVGGENGNYQDGVVSGFRVPNSCQNTAECSTPPVCQGNPVYTLPYSSSEDNCACSYQQTCGLFRNTSSCFGPVTASSYDACADVCDDQTDCTGFLYFNNGTCTTCSADVGGPQGDGTAGVVSGYRVSNSCQNTAECSTQPVCAARPVTTIPYDAATENCACSYQESCGVFPDLSTCNSLSTAVSFADCADQTDDYTDSFAFVYYANGTCAACGENVGGTVGNGAAGAVSGYRLANSCQNTAQCLSPSS